MTDIDKQELREKLKDVTGVDIGHVQPSYYFSAEQGSIIVYHEQTPGPWEFVVMHVVPFKRTLPENTKFSPGTVAMLKKAAETFGGVFFLN